MLSKKLHIILMCDDSASSETQMKTLLQIENSLTVDVVSCVPMLEQVLTNSFPNLILVLKSSTDNNYTAHLRRIRKDHHGIDKTHILIYESWPEKADLVKILKNISK